MKIGIANDHQGYKLKEELKKLLMEEGHEIKDFGTDSEERIDYPMYAFKLGESIYKKEIEIGIAICGTGTGMSIACNKVKGIMCAKINNIEEAKMAKEHNNADILAFSSKNKKEEAMDMINAFIAADFRLDQAYQRRIDQIKEYENNHEC